MGRKSRVLAVLVSVVIFFILGNVVYAQDCKTDFNSAKASYDRGDYAAAAAGFKAVVQSYRACPLASEALFMLGQSLEKMGRTDKAIDAYSVLITYRPDSTFAKRAEERIKALDPALAQKDISSRAQQAVKTEPQLSGPQKAGKPIAGIDWALFWTIIGAIAGVAALLAGWYYTRRKKKSISKFMTEIDDTYSSFKMKSRRCEAELYRLKDMLADELKKGKIDESTYSILEKRIEDYLKEIREQILSEKFGGLPSSMMAELRKMLEDEEISEKEYKKFEALLKKTEGMERDEKEELGKMVKKWRDEDKKR